MKKKNNTAIIILSFISIIACLIAVWAVVSMRNMQQPHLGVQGANMGEALPSKPIEDVLPTPEPTPTPEPLTNQIALPQFAWLTMKAGTKEQTTTFTNPVQNFAQFRVSILLGDETLYESELLHPGDTSEPVRLSRALDAGEYEANLVYMCFSNDSEMRPMNGANSPITLKVK